MEGMHGGEPSRLGWQLTKQDVWVSIASTVLSLLTKDPKEEPGSPLQTRTLVPTNEVIRMMCYHALRTIQHHDICSFSFEDDSLIEHA